MSTRSQINFFVNSDPDMFPDNQNYFKLLGLLTHRDRVLLRLKGKPLSLKSKSRGSIDIIIRNVKEFELYIGKGLFQKQHLSSLMTQLFDLLFTLNCLFQCIVRLLNR